MLFSVLLSECRLGVLQAAALRCIHVVPSNLSEVLSRLSPFHRYVASFCDRLGNKQLLSPPSPRASAGGSGAEGSSAISTD